MNSCDVLTFQQHSPLDLGHFPLVLYLQGIVKIPGVLNSLITEEKINFPCCFQFVQAMFQSNYYLKYMHFFPANRLVLNQQNLDRISHSYSKTNTFHVCNLQSRRFPVKKYIVFITRSEKWGIFHLTTITFPQKKFVNSI